MGIGLGGFRRGPKLAMVFLSGFLGRETDKNGQAKALFLVMTRCTVYEIEQSMAFLRRPRKLELRLIRVCQTISHRLISHGYRTNNTFLKYNRFR
jgi:hypothetical protein